MARTLLCLLAVVSSIAGAVLVFTTTYFPVLKSSFNYSYRIVDTNMHLFYLIAFSLLSFALICDKIRKDIAWRLSLLPIVLTCGCLIYTSDLTEEGLTWIARQTAYDAPSWDKTEQDHYWQKYTELTGHNHRGLYETWGPQVHLNEVAVFSDSIWALSKGQAEQLLQAAGFKQSYQPNGIYQLYTAIAFQLLASFLLIIRRFKYA